MTEDDSLREEIEEMFADQAREAAKAARPTPKIRPGYYDDKRYHDEEEEQ